jgi:NitT/TauT family transport system ATP-binding protein
MASPISIKGVSRRFGETWALQQVDLEIAAGEFVALVGPSGCGKTTLLRIVADLVAPSSGEVRIGDDTAAEARRKRLLGLVSQRPAVLPWKRAIDDVRFTQKIAGKVGFDPATVLREFGLEGHENKRARQLSGGMLQRVNIASAMAHDPSVLLMDEPFSALDEMKREEIGEWFDRELTLRPKTVLFVTHHIDEAVMLADRLLVFSPAPGRVVEIVSVDVPRPREPSFRQDPRFVSITGHVRGLLMHKSVDAA